MKENKNENAETESKAAFTYALYRSYVEATKNGLAEK